MYLTHIADIITISPEIQSGMPVFSKTRVPVKILFEYLIDGDTIEGFLVDFPSVKREQVVALLNILANQYTLSRISEADAA